MSMSLMGCSVHGRMEIWDAGYHDTTKKGGPEMILGDLIPFLLLLLFPVERFDTSCQRWKMGSLQIKGRRRRVIAFVDDSKTRMTLGLAHVRLSERRPAGVAFCFVASLPGAGGCERINGPTWPIPVSVRPTRNLSSAPATPTEQPSADLAPKREKKKLPESTQEGGHCSLLTFKLYPMA